MPLVPGAAPLIKRLRLYTPDPSSIHTMQARHFLLRTRRAPPLPSMARVSHGFTMIELMVVVAILATLAALAGPSFTPLIERWRVRQATEEMIGALYFARSEAVKRGGSVRIEKESSGGGCTAATTQEWNCGWFVYHDVDNSNSFTTAGSNPDVLLQKYPAIRNVEVVHQGGGAGFNLDRWGKANGLNANGFVFIPKGKTIASPLARGICMSSGGRIKTIENPPC